MILKSASKLVFILLSVALCVLTYIGTVDSKDFIVLVSMTFSYYFTRKQEQML